MAIADFRMTRCECERIAFDEVAKCAEGKQGLCFNQLCEVASCGRVCTACHCDLKCYLRERGLCVAETAGDEEEVA